MEYMKEFENLKKEINESGKRLDSISELMKGLSNIKNANESINNFQVNEVINRIESKIDVLAQSDPADLISFLIEELNTELNSKYSELEKKIISLDEIKDRIDDLINNKEASPATEVGIDGIESIKDEISSITSNYEDISQNITSLSAKIDNLATSSDDSADKKDLLESYLEETKTLFNKIEKASLEDVKEEFSNLYELVKNSNSTLSVEIADIKGQIVDLGSNINSFQSIESISENFQNIHDKLGILLETLDLANDKSFKNNGEIKEILNESGGEVSFNLNKNLEVFKSLANELQVKLNTIESAVEDDNNATEHIKINLEAFAEQLNALKDYFYSIYEIVQSKTSTKKDLEELNKELNYLGLTLNEVKSAVEKEGSICSNFEDLKDNLENTNDLIESIKQNTEDNSEFEKLSDYLIPVKTTVENIENIISDDTRYEEIKSDINELREQLNNLLGELAYPLNNLESVSENFYSLQDKLNILLENANINNNEALNLDWRFDNVHKHLDDKIVKNIFEIKESLQEFRQKTGKIEDSVDKNIEKAGEIKDSVDNIDSEILKVFHSLDNIQENLSLKSNFEDVEKTKAEIIEFKDLFLSSPEIAKIKDVLDKSLTIEQNIVDLTDIASDNTCLNDGFENVQGKLEGIRYSLGEIKNIVEDDELLKTGFNELTGKLGGLQHYAEQIKASVEDNAEFVQLGKTLENIININRNIKTKIEDESFINEVRERFGQTGSDIEYIISSLNDKTDMAFLREKLDEVGQNLSQFRTDLIYPLNNLETVNESFESIQDKLNVLIESTNINSNEALINALNLDRRFLNVHEHLDNKIIGSISELRENLDKLRDKTQSLLNNQESSLDTDQTLITELEKLDVKLNNSISGLQTIFESLNGLASKEDVTNLSSQLENVREINENLRQNLNLEEIQSKLSAINSSLERVKEFSENVSYDEELGYIKTYLDNILDKVKFSSQVQDIEKIKEDINLEGELYRLQKSLNEIITAKFEGLKPLNDDIYGLQEKLDILIEKANQYPSVYEIEDVLAKDEIQQTVYSVKNDIEYSIESGFKEIQGYKEELSSLKESFSGLYEKINQTATSVDIENIKNNINSFDLDAKISRIEEHINSSIDKKFDKINRFDNELSYIKESIAGLIEKTGLNSASFDVEHLKNNLNIDLDLNAACSKIESIFDAKLENIDSLESNIADLREKLSNIPAEPANALQEPEELGIKVEKISRDLNSLSEKLNLTSTVADIENIKSDLNLSTKIHELQNHIDLSINSKFEDINNFREDIYYLKDNLYQIEEKFGYVNEKLSEFGLFLEKASLPELEEATSGIKPLSEVLSAKFEASISELKKSFDNFANNYQNTIPEKGSTDSINAQQIKAGLSDFTLSIADISENVAKLCEEVHSFKGIVDQVKDIKEDLELTSDEEANIQTNERLEYLIQEIRGFKELANISQNNEQTEKVLNNIDEIKNKLDSLTLENFENSLQGSVQYLSEIFSKISNASNKEISGSLEIFESKIDNLYNKITEISEVQNQLNYLSHLIEHKLVSKDDSEIKEKLGFILEEVQKAGKLANNQLSEVEKETEAVSKEAFDSNLSLNSHQLIYIQDRIEKVLNEVRCYKQENLSYYVDNKSIFDAGIYEVKNSINDLSSYFGEKLSANAEMTCIEINGIASKLEELKSKTSEISEKIGSAPGNTSISEEEAVIAKEDIGIIQTKLTHINEVLNFVATKINNEDTCKSNENTGVSEQFDIAGINRSLALLQDQLNNLSVKIDQVPINFEHQQLEINLDGLEEKLASEFSQIKDEIYKLQDKVNSLSNINTEQGCDRLHKSNGDYHTAEAISNEESSSEKADLSSFQSYISAFSSQLLEKFRELEQRVGHQEIEINLDEINERISNEFNQVRTELGSIQDRITVLSDKVDIAQNVVEGENPLENNIQAEIQQLSRHLYEELAALITPITTAVELTGSLKDSVDEKFDSLESLNEENKTEFIERFEQICRKAEENFDGIASISKDLSNKLDDITEKFSSVPEKTNEKLDEFLSENKSVHDGIKDNFDKIEKILESLQNISEAAENQVNLTSEKFDNIKNQVGDLAEQIDGFNTDINDISSKLNKLIINSDGNVESLKEKIQISIKELRDEINNNIETKSRKLSDNNENLVDKLSNEIEEISNKVDKANSLSLSGLNSSRTTQEAIIQMAEWIDAAGRLIEENNKNIKKNSLDRIELALSQTESNIIENVEKITSKFNNFEVRLECIEGKIEKLQEIQSEYETKNLLSEIKVQVEENLNQNKSNDAVLERMEKFEHQVSEFDSKIEKILNIIEEKL